jgi:hypothetical protein
MRVPMPRAVPELSLNHWLSIDLQFSGAGECAAQPTQREGLAPPRVVGVTGSGGRRA